MGFLAGDRQPQPAERGNADGLRFGEGHEDLGQIAGAADGPGADKGQGRHRHIHQGHFAQAPGRFAHQQALVAPQGDLGGHPAAGVEPAGQPGAGGFAQLRKGVVGAGGQGQQRNVADLGGHRLVGAVATEHGDQRHLALGHPARRPAGVLDALAQGQVEEFQGRPVLLPGLAAAAVLLHRGGDAGHVGGHQHLGDTGGAEGRQQALDHRDLVGAGEQAGVGGEAAHITARSRVGDDADGEGAAVHGLTAGGAQAGENIGHLVLILRWASRRGLPRTGCQEPEQGRCQLWKNRCKGPCRAAVALACRCREALRLRRCMSGCTGLGETLRRCVSAPPRRRPVLVGSRGSALNAPTTIRSCNRRPSCFPHIQKPMWTASAGS